MKTLPICLLISLALVYFAAEKKNPPGKDKAKAQDTKPAAAASAKPAVPVKPVVPEKKMPYELWMAAHSQAVEAAEQKKYDEALKLFDEAAKVANRGVLKNNSLYAKVELLSELGRYDEALQQLNAPVTSRDQKTAYHQARCSLLAGTILMKKGDLDAAEKEFQKAAAFEVNNWISADAEISLGKIACLRKDINGALARFKKLFNDETRLPGIRCKALMAGAEVLRQEKRFSEAYAYLEALETIEQLPASSAVAGAFLRSELLIEMKDLNNAKTQLEKALNIPGKPAFQLAEIYSRMAGILFSQKRYREAQSMIRRARGIRGHAEGYDRELHKTIDWAVAKENRERAIRERKARQERERKARLDRQRRAEKERRAKQARQKLKQQKNAPGAAGNK
jgi:tetratricopeptide (TPR) repeat protein